MKSDYTVLTDSTCLLCRTGEAEGLWQLCRPCRDRLIEKSARFAATARPAVSVGCGTRRPPSAPRAGVYCPRCEARFVRHYRCAYPPA